MTDKHAETDGRVEDALYQRAVGIVREDVKVRRTSSGRKLLVKTVTRRPPDPLAIRRWLEMRRPGQWGEKPELHREMVAEFSPEMMEMVLRNKGMPPEEVQKRMAQLRVEAAARTAGRKPAGPSEAEDSRDETVEQNLALLASGYSLTTNRIFESHDGSRLRLRTQVDVAPDAKLQDLWLARRLTQKWRDKLETTPKLSIVLKHIPDQQT
jgi:hypothetical protein